MAVVLFSMRQTPCFFFQVLQNREIRFSEGVFIEAKVWFIIEIKR